MVAVIRIILIIININIAIELVKATQGILGRPFPWLQKIVLVRIGLNISCAPGFFFIPKNRQKATHLSENGISCP
jgi:hypothetical protein